VLTEENLDKIVARLEHTTEFTEIPCTRNWHLEISLKGVFGDRIVKLWFMASTSACTHPMHLLFMGNLKGKVYRTDFHMGEELKENV
jgi:hypothetical protein